MRRILLYFVLIVSLLGPADIVFAENSYVWAGLGDGNSLTRIDPNLYGNDLNNWDANDPSPGEVGP